METKCTSSRADKYPKGVGNITQHLLGSWSRYNLSASLQWRRVVTKLKILINEANVMQE